MTTQPKSPNVLPILDMRRRLEANLMAQAELGREISALKSGALKSDAEKRLVALKTDLIALNVEMRMRTGQVSGNA
jgi:hypothetical protein